MASVTYREIQDSLRRLYLDDPRPWLVGFSGGKDSSMVASLMFDAVAGIPRERRTKPVSVLCTDTRVEIPAIVEMIDATLARMQKFSRDNALNIELHLLRPPPEQSFWVNIIGRGYPPPNRTFRWCTQRLKIDPVTVFVQKRIGHWGEAILHLGARRAESATRAQTMAGREARNGLRRHPDLPRVWVSNPIEFLSTEEVWAYLLQKPNPWGGDNRPLYNLYANAAGGECPIQIDTSTPSCGNSRFGCWTCTVVERDRASEGLLAAGDERMEKLIEFRETLIEFRDPANGWRDKRRMNGNDGPGPLTIEARRELLKRLLALQEETHLPIITPEELLLIQQMWKAAREPDDGRGVARIVNKQRGVIMSADLKELNRLRELEEEVAREKGINADALRRMLAKVEEYSESHRAHGLPDDLLNILKDELVEREPTALLDACPNRR
jgi:DNA sulfur modification protein DndC